MPAADSAKYFRMHLDSFVCVDSTRESISGKKGNLNQLHFSQLIFQLQNNSV